MQKPNLFFDFDDTMFMSLMLQVLFINEYYKIQTKIHHHRGRNHELDAIIKNELPDLILERSQIYGSFTEGFLLSIDQHKDMEPMENLKRILPLLARKYRIWIVTARPKEGLPVIEYVLKVHGLRQYIHGIHCAWSYSNKGVFTMDMSKKDFISSITEGENIAFFDDFINEIKKTYEVIRSFLFDHDSFYKNIEIEKVNGWEQIGHLLL